jgi:uncharacterized NAD-dependent epimerase/dehydratase family protein
MAKESAIVLTNGWLKELRAKTAHGLLHESFRFHISALIDPVYAGNTTSEVLNQVQMNVPIYRNVEESLKNLASQPSYCIIGVAVHGGNLPTSLRSEIIQAIKHHLSIVSGLHSYLSDDEEFRDLADKYQVQLIDIRKPRPVKELRFWTGDIYRVKTPRIALLGMDCAIGKRTTGMVLMKLCRELGIKTELIYTGQTGWMQGLKYGFIFDATVNDFLGGEIERVIMDCDQQAKPELILLEGQGSLRNPAGPGGSEFIVSGNCKAVILQHAPGRKYFEGFEHLKPLIPDIAEEIELIRLYGARTLAITLNAQNMSGKRIKDYQKQLENQLGIPVILPLTEQGKRLISIIRNYITTGK